MTAVGLRHVARLVLVAGLVVAAAAPAHAAAPARGAAPAEADRAGDRPLHKFLPVADRSSMSLAYEWLDVDEEATARDVDRYGARPTVVSRTLAIWATAARWGAVVGTNPATPEGVGNLAAQAVIAFRRHDGSNQLGDEPPPK